MCSLFFSENKQTEYKQFLFIQTKNKTVVFLLNLTRNDHAFLCLQTDGKKVRF